MVRRCEEAGKKLGRSDANTETLYLHHCDPPNLSRQSRSLGLPLRAAYRCISACHGEQFALHNSKRLYVSVSLTSSTMNEVLADFYEEVQQLTARGAHHHIECTRDLLDMVDAWFEDVKAGRVNPSEFVLKTARKVLNRICKDLVSMKDVDPEDALGFSEKVTRACMQERCVCIAAQHLKRV
jgi:hypothetical protein